MTIYSKTMEGRLQAFDKQSPLPAPLKDLLKRVDGKTSSEELGTHMGTWPGSADLLRELERRNLVQANKAQRVVTDIGAARPPAAQSRPESVALEYFATEPVPLFPASAPRKQAAEQPSHTEIQAIRECMATFILTYLPHYARSLLKEIEDIDSYEKLMGTLDGYAFVTQEAGRAGLNHIRELRLMLRTRLDD